MKQILLGRGAPPQPDEKKLDLRPVRQREDLDPTHDELEEELKLTPIEEDDVDEYGRTHRMSGH